METLDFMGEGSQLLVVAIAGSVALVFILIVAALISATGGNTHNRRLEQVKLRGSGKRSSTGHIAIKRGEATGALGGIERTVGRWMPRKEALQSRLTRTGKKLTVAHYIVGIVVTALFFFAVCKLFFGLSLFISILVGIAQGLMLPHLAVGHLGKRRLARFTSTFPEAIDLIVRGLRSGLPISESIVTVSKEIGDPIGTEFRTIDQSIKLGRSMEEAMWDTAKRIDTAEFKFFVISISVQRETGGNLAETLENLSDILRRRRQMKLKVKALSSEARASAYIIGSLPFAVFSIIMIINPGYAMDLFNDPRGLVMVAGGLTSMGIGSLVMAKMVRFEI